MLNFRLCKSVHLHRDVCIVFFAQITNRNDLNNHPCVRLNNNRFQTSLLAGWAKIQWARDDEGAQTCINEGST